MPRIPPAALLLLLPAACLPVGEDLPFIPLYNLYETCGVCGPLDWEPRPDGLVFGAVREEGAPARC